ncbi:receptor-like protein EIX1 isoform X2 [Salvia miltiorrhiza]|uniref:receptor-like protein EIX1 isoform X1 n=1 Tax=Salvia miltiorrhiza TaxID=226208 RepID=UPI0025ABE268|nr:receptor-like protein EIX1 isoform X1 [Salvia miltiorrhiza]XP_057792748.1 receptor-like protein EIX1 isoform X2 [Salvia miltiorrhiza]
METYIPQILHTYIKTTMISHKSIAIKFIFLVCLCFEYKSFLVSGRCLEREREALMRFKNGLIDAHDTLSSWRAQPDCCDWEGVVCSNATTAHVVALLLNNSTLGGEIVSALLDLTRLSRLDLSYNRFNGTRIPGFLGSMKRLQHLNLSMASLAGGIPPELGNLTHLRTLDLSNDLLEDDTSYLNTLNGPIPNIFAGLNLLELLDLSGNMLQGEIPKSLGNMSHLQVLNLHNNDLQGHIHQTFVNFPSLQNLDLGYNQLSGPLPRLGGLFRLRKVYFAYNKFSGPVPVTLGQLPNLEVVDLCFNSLQGTISQSDHFIKLHKLKVLDFSFNTNITMQISDDWSPPFQLDIINLGGCKLGPIFPKWIRNQTDLSWLDLSSSGIADEVPQWLWNLFPPLPKNSTLSPSPSPSPHHKSYRYLNLSHNQISGAIPDLSHYQIDIIDVSSNSISGPIPLFQPYTYIFQLSQNIFTGSIKSMCSYSHLSLAILDISINRLAGELPDCWDEMSSLQALNLANNSFSGEIPRSLGSLDSLVALHLRDNRLSGELPFELKNCRNLRLVDVGENELTGRIPAWIGASYSYLINLSLRSNGFHGSIPVEICNLTRIQVLDVSRNNLSGKIPECFSNFTTLVEKTNESTNILHIAIKIPYDLQSSDAIVITEDIEYSLVQWKGRESEYRKNLALLKLIDLSSNRLTGGIPQSFSTMKELISLNLSRNNLTGDIIPDIAGMEMLECLDLATNRLSGKIPMGMAQLHYLDVLDLSGNNLTGKIPTSTQLQSFAASVYGRNDGLCGPPLGPCPGEGPTTATVARGEDVEEGDEGVWRLSLMQGFGISLGFGFIVGFWGVVGALLVKESWRYAYFNLLDDVGNWFLVTIALFGSKLRRSAFRGDQILHVN